jgi:hypothetical protein
MSAEGVGDRGSTFESRSHERMGSIMYPFRMQVITIGIGMGHLIPSLEPILSRILHRVTNLKRIYASATLRLRDEGGGGGDDGSATRGTCSRALADRL